MADANGTHVNGNGKVNGNQTAALPVPVPASQPQRFLIPPKTKEDFIRRWQDEMVGLLMASFLGANAEPVKFADADHYHERKNACVGKAMIEQMKRAKEILSRMYDDILVNKVS